jgi:hypothetical protein
MDNSRSNATKSVKNYKPGVNGVNAFSGANGANGDNDANGTNDVNGDNDVNGVNGVNGVNADLHTDSGGNNEGEGAHHELDPEVI